MSYWSRVVNVFRADRVSREIDEEMQCHLADAIAEGRDPKEARRAFGSTLRQREESRDVRLSAWLDSLRADGVFGWRQLRKNRIVSAAAILSLALAVGACTSAFRLIDAVLLRPLPVADADRLFCLTYDSIDDATGKTETGDSFEYPMFRELRAAAKGQAELMAISYASRIDLTYGSDQDMEKAYRQYVSGWMFPTFQVGPALGRVLLPDDDRKPGAHPYAVLSYDYWSRRFARDPKVVGKTFRAGDQQYEIVGVAGQGFTGTETGTMTDVFVPTMMNAKAIDNPNWGWFRTWVKLSPGVSAEQVRERLQATITSYRREKAKDWGSQGPAKRIEAYVNSAVHLEPAAAGVSGIQKDYRQSLLVLAVVVGLVLLIACANVANLMMAQASSRAREMALRISIGAGRRRLIQLLLVESALVAVAASVLGGLFAWWSAPFVVSMINPPDNPARLVLSADWRVLAFAVSLAVGVTLLFGLAPALRASAMKPIEALRGGENPHSRRKLMNALVAAQVAFCFLVHFVSGLFIATFQNVAHQPTGFAVENVLTVETVAKQEQPMTAWDELLRDVKDVAGVESAGLCTWPLMSGNGWSSGIQVNGREDPVPPYFLGVSPGWLETMRIPLIDGRDFRQTEMQLDAAIVNEAFAKKYFNGQNPVGRSFSEVKDKKTVSTPIIGYVRDARYRDMREAIRPTVYVPFAERGKGSDWGTFVVYVAPGAPPDLPSRLRQQVHRSRPEFRASNVETQGDLVRQHTVRERLLATLSLFFAVVALLLAGVGLYGVLHYSVLQRRREIGIRMALGAVAVDVARRVMTEVFAMLVVGAGLGLASGMAMARYLDTLLYQVKGTDVMILAFPAVTIFVAAMIAAVPSVVEAVRVDPASALRVD